MTEVKKLLGNTISIGGNVPSSLILTGTTEEVKKYCKNLIDVVGKDGSYVMSFGVALNEGKAENIHTMIDFTKEYGVYKK
jgi:uroporphyrinogen-III decarboxylase